ncbi:MAG: LysM peptidoglycan-binding domain-containing protein [Anaerolineales bacterium]|nr:LysM peptidoglycan-binding domain-containing protein [Anaerolineales bacterium]
MSNKQRGLLVVFIFIVSTMLISACTQSLSAAPVATPTLLPTGLFVSPFPSVENPMAMIEEFAKQTAAAQTSVAGGTAGTPQAITTVGTVITPQAGVTSTPGVSTPVPGTPTNAVPTTPAAAGLTPVFPSGPTTTPVPAGVRPASYTLQNGEFPYCIARRFNVDPDALLSASGLTSPDLYYPGLTLTIPQSGAFPGARMLASHPATYTVVSSDETIYSIACKFGDVDPASIASANSISISASLTAGQALKIP